jgi:penicillin-binding protein 2
MTTPELGQTPRRATLLSRFLAFGLCIALVVVSLSARLAYLQLSPERPFAQLGDATRVVSQPIEAARGLISDRNGTSLVTNVPAFAIKVRPAELPFSEREPVVGHLGDLLGLSPSVINQLLDRNPGSRFDLVTIASDVPEDVARVVSEDSLQLPGVYVQVEATRQYPYGSLMAEIIGYTGAIDADQLK